MRIDETLMRGVMGLRGRLEGGAGMASPSTDIPRPETAEADPVPPLVAMQSWRTEQPIVAIYWLHSGVLAVATDLGPRTLLRFYNLSGEDLWHYPLTPNSAYE